MGQGQQQAGWAHPRLLMLVILLAGLPLWLPVVPPLIDLPAHMGRYAV